MRTKTPFVEAFKEEQLRNEGKLAPKAEESESKTLVDTKPKRMSESFHKVVSSSLNFRESVLI